MTISKATLRRRLVRNIEHAKKYNADYTIEGLQRCLDKLDKGEKI
jgi:hypothetical protein